MGLKKFSNWQHCIVFQLKINPERKLNCQITIITKIRFFAVTPAYGTPSDLDVIKLICDFQVQSCIDSCRLKVDDYIY